LMSAHQQQPDPSASNEEDQAAGPSAASPGGDAAGPTSSGADGAAGPASSGKDSDSTAPRGTWLGLAVLVVTAALWSLNGPLIKLLTQGEDGLDGVAIACCRSLLGGLVFAPFAMRHASTLRRVSIGWPIFSVLMFTLMTVCFVIATTMTAAANAVILQYTSPLWVFLLSPLLLKEKPGRSEGAALIIALVGIVVICGGKQPAGGAGLIVALGSGFGYGALTVALRGLRSVHPVAVASMNTLGSGLLLVPAVLLTSTFAMTLEQVGLVLLLSIVQFALPYVLFSWALQRVEAHRASIIVLLETVLNPLWTYLVIGEVVPHATLLGGPLILLSVVVWIILRYRHHRLRRAYSPDAPGPDAHLT
jgi:DME family drug/metabolite transporter